MKRLIIIITSFWIGNVAAVAPVYEAQPIDSLESSITSEIVEHSSQQGGADEGNVVVVAEKEQTTPSVPTGDNSASTGGTPYQLLNQKLQSLQVQIASLQGQLETQAHRLDELQHQQVLVSTKPQQQSSSDEALPHEVKAFTEQQVQQSQDRVDDETVVASSARMTDTAADANANPSSHAARPHSMNEQLAYMAAFELIKAKKYDVASTKLEAFLSQYPDGPYAANAYYWLGEIHYARGHYRAALVAFDTVAQQFADSSKVAAALFKSGMACEHLGQPDKAKTLFRQVVDRYPGTAVARLAALKLS